MRKLQCTVHYLTPSNLRFLHTVHFFRRCLNFKSIENFVMLKISSEPEKEKGLVVYNSSFKRILQI